MTLTVYHVVVPSAEEEVSSIGKSTMDGTNYTPLSSPRAKDMSNRLAYWASKTESIEQASNIGTY